MAATRQAPLTDALESRGGPAVPRRVMIKFCAGVVREIVTLRVFRFLGEALRQAGILIVSSMLVIWGLVFIIGLQCGIEGAYLLRAQGAPSTRACSRPGAICASSFHSCSAT